MELLYSNSNNFFLTSETAIIKGEKALFVMENLNLRFYKEERIIRIFPTSSQ